MPKVWHAFDNCPAKGKVCRACSKLNNFAKCCRNKTRSAVHDVKQQTADAESEAELCSFQLDSLTNVNRKPDTWFIDVNINKIQTTAKVDTGAQVNVLSFEDFQRLNDASLEVTSKTITSYSGHNIPVCEFTTVKVRHKTKTILAPFYVVKQAAPALSSWACVLVLIWVLWMVLWCIRWVEICQLIHWSMNMLMFLMAWGP